MKHLLLIFILVPFLGLAAKTYQFEITVEAVGSLEPLEGIEVVLTSQDEPEQRQVTNKEGKVVFTIKKKTLYNCQVLGESILYSNRNFEIYRTNRRYLSEYIYLNPPPKDPSAFIAECEKIVDAFFANEGKDLVIDTSYECAEGTTSFGGFPGGYDKFGEFVASHMVYPQEAIEMGIEGKVYLRIIIGYHGEVDDVRVLRGLEGCANCDKEALRILKLVPRWIPAYCDKKLLRIFYDIPFSFRLN